MSATGGTVSLWLRAELLKRYFLVPSDELVYVALTRTVAQANATGDQLDEPTGGGYQRMPVGLGSDSWAASGYGEVYNRERSVFAAATGNWGLIGGWALVSDLTSGVTLAVGRMVNPAPVVPGVEPVVEVGSLVVGLYD